MLVESAARDMFSWAADQELVLLALIECLFLSLVNDGNGFMNNSDHGG